MRALLLLAAVPLFLGSAIPAAGQTCPANLTALDSQVSTAPVKQVLSKSFDELIQEAGGLSQAIAAAEADKVKYETRLASLPADVSDFERNLNEDAVLVAGARVTALRCREAS